MPMHDALLAEWDHETAGTRRMLALIPDAQHAFAPHAKSMPLGKLGTHLATIGLWAHMTCTEDAMDLAASPPAPKPTSTAEILAIHDEWVAKGRAAIAATPDAAMFEPWTLRLGDHTVFTLPRAVVLRTSVFNHAVHHRGQLSVYLRLLDIPVPGLYGPSADER